MANKFTTKVTNEGLNLLQLASQQDKKVEFINVIASSTVYGENQLISETYDDINSRAFKNQTGKINNLTIDKNITKMELVFDGHDIKSDYTLNSIFLIAKLKDSQDLKLFAIIKANQPQYMNSYDGSGSTNLQINLGVKFSNNDKVTLQIDTAAIATLGDLSNLRNETQAKLDKETTRATEKEKNLALDIETEKNRAIKAENTLQTNIDTIDSRAQSEEKKLSNKLDTETTRAIQAEENLQSNITSEQNRAMTQENILASKIVQASQTLTTQINEGIKGVSSEVKSVSNRLDNLSVGGTNLMRNTTRDYVKFTGGGWGVDYLTPNHQAVDTPVEGGETYTFSVWVKNDSSSAGRVDLEIYQYNAKGESIENSSSSEVGVWVSPGEEKRSVFTKTLLSDTTRVIFHTRNRDNNGTVTYWTKMAQVEKGNIATDWSPAPEDLQEDIKRNMSEAILSLKVISKTVSVDRINARSNVTVTVDVGFGTGYTSQLANLSVLVCSNSNVSVTNFWYDGSSKKLYVLIENPTTDVITNMKLFCKIPTFKNSNLI